MTYRLAEEHHGRVRRRTVGLVIGALLLAMTLPAWAQFQGIHVAGQGMLEVEPDMGYVQLHARREGQDPAALKRELDEVIRAVLKLTDRLGIDPKDVTAAAVSITPRLRHQDGETLVDGLIASRTLDVTLRKIDQFGELINGALELGINNVDPIRLDSSRRDALEDEALVLAMADAQAEAARVATGFGVPLGAVIDVQVGGRMPAPGFASGMMMRAEAGGGSFSPGLIRIERSVDATFGIVPAPD